MPFLCFLCLCVKTILCVIPFIWKCVLPTSSLSCKLNSFSFKRRHNITTFLWLFESAELGNSECKNKHFKNWYLSSNMIGSFEDRLISNLLILWTLTVSERETILTEHQSGTVLNILYKNKDLLGLHPQFLGVNHFHGYHTE